jgi:hypothetical protein
MKNSLNYLNLWQQKRNEMPVNDSVQNDWLEMQGLLDQHLPNPLQYPKPSVSTGVKSLRILKGWNLALVALSAAALICALVYFIKIKHPQQNKNHKKSENVINKDSLLNTPDTDSLSLVSSMLSTKDSLWGTRQLITNDSLRIGNKPTNAAIKDSIGGIDSRSKLAPTHPASGISNINPNNKKGTSTSNPKSLLVKNTGNTTLSTRNAPGRSTSNNPNRPIPGKHNNHKPITSMLANSNQPKLFPPPGIKTGFSADSGRNRSGTGNVPDPILQLLASNEKSVYGLTRVDNFQTDLNNYFLPPTSNRIYSGTLTTNQNTANITSIVNKLNRSFAQQLRTVTKPKQQKPAANRTSGAARASGTSIIDWGVLTGVNSPNSFGPKKQNANFYGSLPIDLYFGLYGTYHFNNKWAVNVQVKALNAQKLSGSYSHANDSKTDSAKADSGAALKITDSRKAYFINVPIHVVYRINNFLSIKAGPVINIPVKQVNGNTVLLPEILKVDTTYYTTVTNQLKKTRYDQKLNFGISGGVSMQYNRLSLEATYSKSITGYRVVSDLGSYKSNPCSVQITIGFRLNKPKSK